MLGDEEMKHCNVPESFIVREHCNLGDDGEESPHFDTEDDLSYSEGSDCEVETVRTKKTKHRVYDKAAECKNLNLARHLLTVDNSRLHLSTMD
jgi:hypothetical protein